MLNYCFHTLAQEQDQSANYMPHSYVRVNTDFFFFFFFLLLFGHIQSPLVKWKIIFICEAVITMCCESVDHKLPKSYIFIFIFYFLRLTGLCFFEWEYTSSRTCIHLTASIIFGSSAVKQHQAGWNEVALPLTDLQTVKKTTNDGMFVHTVV